MKDDWNSPERQARSRGFAAGYEGMPQSKAPAKYYQEWLEGWEAATGKAARLVKAIDK